MDFGRITYVSDLLDDTPAEMWAAYKMVFSTSYQDMSWPDFKAVIKTSGQFIIDWHTIAGPFLPIQFHILTEKQPTAPGPNLNVSAQRPYPSAYYAPQPGQAPIIPRYRYLSPDELVEALAQLDTLRRTTQEVEVAEIGKQIAKLQGNKSPKTGDESLDPLFSGQAQIFPLDF